MSRLPMVPSESDQPVLSALFAQVSAQGHAVPHLYRVLGNAPDILHAWTALAWPLRQDAETPRWLRELLIMRVAQLTGATYESAHHRPMALQSGVSAAQLEELDGWPGSDLFDDLARAALMLTDELTTTGRVTDDAFDALAARCDATALIEIVVTVAFYCCVSRVLHAFQIDLEPDYLEALS